MVFSNHFRTKNIFFSIVSRETIIIWTNRKPKQGAEVLVLHSLLWQTIEPLLIGFSIKCYKKEAFYSRNQRFSFRFNSSRHRQHNERKHKKVINQMQSIAWIKALSKNQGICTEKEQTKHQFETRSKHRLWDLWDQPPYNRRMNRASNAAQPPRLSSRLSSHEPLHEPLHWPLY